MLFRFLFSSFETYLPTQRIPFMKENSTAKISFICSFFKIFEDLILYVPISFI